MSKDKYLSVFFRQIKAILLEISFRYFFATHVHAFLKIGQQGYSSVLAGEYSDLFRPIIVREQKQLIDYKYNVALSEAMLLFILQKANQKFLFVACIAL